MGARTTLVDDIDELLILTPYLDAALAADAGGPAEAERVAGGADPAFGLPVDASTLLALQTLAAEVPRAAYWAAGVVAEPPLVRSIAGHLRHFPRWHERMLVTAATREADALAGVARTLRRQVRLALGLRVPDRRLGQFCPMHDDPLVELVKPGAEARLKLAGERVVGVEWQLADEAACRSCGASWPPCEYLLLGRQLRDADARRLAAAAEAVPCEETA